MCAHGRPERECRVVVADDDAHWRAWARAALESAGITVVAEADNGLDAVRLTAELRPDVLLMDVVMPILDGIGATARIVDGDEVTRVVLVTTSHDELLAVLGLRAGATGHLFKDEIGDGLADAVREAAAGDPVLAPAIVRHLVDRLGPLTHGPPAADAEPGALLARARGRDE